jgi:TonB family protein
MATPIKYRNGFLGTFLFHGMLLCILLFMAFRTPLPLPEEQGIMVDFGNSAKGSGSFEPQINDPAIVRPQPKTQQTIQPTEEIITQDNEETVALPPSKPNIKPVEKTVENPVETTKPVEQSKPAETQKPDSRALYPGRGNASSSATSQGETDGNGNQGVPSGAPNVHVYGEGIEIGGGLAGRGISGGLPRPDYNVQDEGTVVVEVIVDKDGNVTKADFRQKGSTTLNSTLINAAIKAARQTKFARNLSVLEQTGTITYIFKLKGE